MVPFCQQTITDPFYFLPFDLDNHSQLHFWDIASRWCHSSVATGSYLDFFISSHLDLLSLSSLLPSTFQCRFLITVVTKSRECPDYKKFVLEILESHLAFCLVTLSERLVFLLSSSISLSLSVSLQALSVSFSFVDFFPLCCNHSVVSYHGLIPSVTMDYHRLANNRCDLLLQTLPY